MKKIKNTLIIIFLTLSINSNGQLAKIELYPEGVECLSVIKQKIDFDESGRIYRKVANPQIWYYPSQKLKNINDKTAVLIIPGGGYEALWISGGNTEDLEVQQLCYEALWSRENHFDECSWRCQSKCKTIA